MAIRNIKKSLIGMQDLAQGVGSVSQTRNKQTYDIARIDVPYAVESEAELQALDINTYTRARVYSSTSAFIDYVFDETAVTGIAPTIGSGYWVAVDNNPATVDSMKLGRHLVGSLILTKGYNSVGDGGLAAYIVEGPQTVDGLINHTLANGNTAIAQLGAVINVRAAGAKLNGTDDSASFQAAVDSLPASGGIIVVPSSQYGCTLAVEVACTKPVKWDIGNIVITGPAVGWILDLQANDSKVIGSGNTKFKLTAPATPVVPAVLTAVMAGNQLSSITIVSGGSGFVTAPIAIFTGGIIEGTKPASILLHITSGVVTSYTILEAGSGYSGVPTVSIIGGGAGAIRNNEPQRTELAGFKLDLSLVDYAVGIYHFGGWYFDYSNIEVLRPTCSATSIGLSIDSHTNGVVGTGSYGGAYVNNLTNIITNVLCCVGHDTSTATTTTVHTIDTHKIILKACVGFSFINPVVQNTGANLVLWDLTLTRALTIVAGDYEGGGTGCVVYLLNGNGNTSLHALNNLYGAFVGTYIVGEPGEHSIIDDYKDGSVDTPIRTGSGGSAGMRYRNTGFKNTVSVGVQYNGDVANLGQNLKQISATQGNLEDETKAGLVIHLNTSGQFKVLVASSGSNPRTLTEILLVEAGQLKTAGKLNMTASDFADNAAALAGGLVVGDLYRVTGSYNVNIVA